MIFKNLSVKELQNVLLGTKGKIFSATFVKKNGKVRDINCRLGVKSHIKGTGSPSFAESSDNPYQLVFDLQKNGYRVINLETIIQINFNKKTYKRGV